MDMKKENYIRIIEQICSVVDLNNSGLTERGNELIPFSMQAICSINDQLVDIKEINKSTIKFELYYPSNVELYIEDSQIEDPTVSILKNGISIRYSDSLFVVLLTNLSMWIYYKVAMYKTSFKEKGAEYYLFTKSNYDFLCGDRPQINQIYYNKNSFMVFINSDIEYFLVAKDEATLKKMQVEIDEVRHKDRKTEKYKFVLNHKFIKELRQLDDGTAQGYTKFKDKDIEIKLDTDKDVPSISDFNLLAQQLKDMLSHFKADKYNVLVQNISNQVVSDIYQQSDINNTELKVECDSFKRNMSLNKIEIYPNGFMLVYDIKSDRNELLFVQLSSTYSIEEITVG